MPPLTRPTIDPNSIDRVVQIRLNNNTIISNDDWKWMLYESGGYVLSFEMDRESIWLVYGSVEEATRMQRFCTCPQP
jgi:hypothetical protein